MSAGPGGLHGRRGGGSPRIRSPRDFYSGLVVVALALVALFAAADLPGHRGLAFGPGTAPRLFAGLLAAVGIVIALVGLFVEGPRVERYAVRGPLLVTASVLVFAATIKPLGLVIATFVTILVAGTASAETRWRELFVWALALTGFCTMLFYYVLGLPLPLWPQL